MGLFFKKTKKTSAQNADIFNTPLTCESIDELIDTLSHFKLHTLAAALYYSAKKINLLDPNHEIIITEEMILRSDENAVIQEALNIVNAAMEVYEKDKVNIDDNYKRHLN
jgi:hypothetical protein